MLPDKTKKLLEEMEQQQRDREHSINSALSNIDRLLDKMNKTDDMVIKRACIESIRFFRESLVELGYYESEGTT